MSETSTVGFSKEEARLLKIVLRTADLDDTDIQKSTELIQNTLGVNVAFEDGTDEFHTNPPSSKDLLECFEGQQFTGTKTDYEALQTVLTVFVFSATNSGESLWDQRSLIDGIHDKISEGHQTTD